MTHERYLKTEHSDMVHSGKEKRSEIYVQQVQLFASWTSGVKTRPSLLRLPLLLKTSLPFLFQLKPPLEDFFVHFFLLPLPLPLRLVSPLPVFFISFRYLLLYSQRLPEVLFPLLPILKTKYQSTYLSR